MGAVADESFMGSLICTGNSLSNLEPLPDPLSTD